MGDLGQIHREVEFSITNSPEKGIETVFDHFRDKLERKRKTHCTQHVILLVQWTNGISQKETSGFDKKMKKGD
jgi:hypothetical protein